MTWWRDAVIYEVYPRSFADGGLAGIRAKLPYLAQLGVDAIWFTPWYPSPMADGGYDVTGYRDVDPAFGTLAEAEQLIAEALSMGLRTIVDIIPNHVSTAHPWFREALAAPPGSPPRDLFHFRPGRGPGGQLPPNDWQSEFGGPAWRRAGDEWYLHLFSPEQPDLNWAHPAVHAEHEDVLRFWYDRGVAGIRVDSANVLAKHPDLPDLADEPDPHPYDDREELHDIFRRWRTVADSYPGDRLLVGELWLDDPARIARHLRPGELHTAFNLPFLRTPWAAKELRDCIDVTLRTHDAVGASPTWVLCNHDVTRTATRYGRADSSFTFEAKGAAHATPADLALGTRRARAAALLTLALPGGVYLYQGEELGLPEVEDLPPALRRDPMHLRSGGTDPGRDGCRVPLPWSGTTPPFGWRDPWLPQPPDWAALTVEAQSGDPDSMLTLYRTALALRRQLPKEGGFGWLPSAPGVLDFRRGALRCVVNLSEHAVPLPEGHDVLLTSGRPAPALAPDTAVWLAPRSGAYWEESLTRTWEGS